MNAPSTSLLPGETVKHQEELDGIRGIAILAVLIAHAVALVGVVPINYQGAVWPSVVRRIFISGWGGVDLFFTLSGYLITGILLRSRGKPQYFRRFYARRALRIFPIYYFVLIASLVLVFLHPSWGYLIPQRRSEIVSYFLYIQNWPVFWKSWAGLTSVWGVFWSLAVEEQFYLIWPTLVRYVTDRLALALCVAGFLAGFIERWWMIHLLGPQLGIIQWPFSRLDGLFLGAGLAFYRRLFHKALPLAWAGGLFALGATIWLWVVIAHTDQLDRAGKELWVFGVMAFALMSAGLVASSHYRVPWLHRVLTVRPLILAGRYSYGIYVYHVIVFVEAGVLWQRLAGPRLGPGLHPALTGLFLLILCMITVLIAAFSFRYIETPFLRMKRFFPTPAAPV